VDEQGNSPAKAAAYYANRRLYNTVNPFAKYGRLLRLLFTYIIAPLMYFVVLVPASTAWLFLRKNEVFRTRTDVLYARVLGQSSGRVLALLAGLLGLGGCVNNWIVPPINSHSSPTAWLVAGVICTCIFLAVVVGVVLLPRLESSYSRQVITTRTGLLFCAAGIVGFVPSLIFAESLAAIASVILFLAGRMILGKPLINQKAAWYIKRPTQ
jgi:hypothetical protein